MSCYGAKPAQLLEAFDKGCGAYSTELLTRNPDDIICPPVLLPGEKLILQQDKVTCVKTFLHPATGALHLTNYRIIFSGKYMKDTSLRNICSPDELSKLGYKYQEERRLLSRVPPNIRKFVTLKRFRKLDAKRGLSRSLSVDDLLSSSNSVSSNSSRISIKNDKNVFDVHIDDEILLTIPLTSVYEVKKFAKQYLPTEKLQMLNNGIEIVTSSYLAIKLCLAEDDSFDADELVEVILQHAQIKEIASCFAHVYARNIELPKNCQVQFNKKTPNLFFLENEIRRLDSLSESCWKEKEQSACSGYPSKVIIPKAACGAGKLKKWAKFHTDGAYPIIVWNHPQKRNVLMRSACTKTPRGDAEQRCIVDEEIMNEICRPCGRPGVTKKLVIYMDRPPGNSTVNANVKKGEGYFYPHCELISLDDLPDIYATHQCALKLQNALSKSDETRYLSSVEECGWLREVEILLDYALCVAVKLNNENTSVLISVGSGFERAAQISSLVQLLMDPYYRTFDGFQVLLQKEWISIKYPFQKRNLVNMSSPGELSPLFLQFLDCVWQLTQQFSTSFEFAEPFLELVALHSYSARFGTFIDEKKSSESSVSLWLYINILIMNHEMLCNFNYDKDSHKGMLQPTNCIPHLKVWTWFTHYKKEESLFIASMCAAVELEKLQRDYMELLSKHSYLLQKLSKVDELTDIGFNSMCVDIPQSPDSIMSSGEDGSEDGSVFDISDEKPDSADGVLRDITGKCEGGELVKIDGFDLCEGGSAIDMLKSLHDDEEEDEDEGVVLKPHLEKKYTCLKEYLDHKGIQHENLRDVAVFKMMVTGYLVKQGGSYKSWKRRFFVADFRKKYVAYFETSVGTKPKGVISYLNIKSVIPTEDKKHKHLFRVETRGRTYLIRAPSEPVMGVWVACLTLPISCLAAT